MSLIPMTDREFIEKLESGERDFSRIVLYNKKHRGAYVVFPYAPQLDGILDSYHRSDKPEGEQQYRLILDQADLRNCSFNGIRFTDLKAKDTMWGGIERCTFAMPCDLSGSKFFVFRDINCSGYMSNPLSLSNAQFVASNLSQHLLFEWCDLRGSNITELADERYIPRIVIAGCKLTPEQEAKLKARPAYAKGVYLEDLKIEPLSEEKKS